MTHTPTFAAWLRAQAREGCGHPIGDLAEDAIGDVAEACLPQITTPSALRRHMIEVHRADEAALYALEWAENAWQADQ